MTEAIRLLYERMVTPGLETVQGFLLVGFYFGGDGRQHPGKTCVRRNGSSTCRALFSADTAIVVLLEERPRTWLTIYIAVHWSASDMAVEPPAAFHA